MIITRTPFRITLGGGGTDLPSFYEQYGGYIFAMTIDKYMYIILKRVSPIEHKSIIRYNKDETVHSLEEITHPLAREALKLHNINEFIELISIADMPAKTGLGSSGSYLVGLLNAIYAYKKIPVSIQTIAEEACHIEMNILKEPVGKQDQYIAAYGGFKTLDINPTGNVIVKNIDVNFTTIIELINKTRIYYTGIQRFANTILCHQNESAKQTKSINHQQVIDNLLRIKEIGKNIELAFYNKDLDRFGLLMDEHWKCKKLLSSEINIPVMDDLYDTVKKEYGVLGGKIIGAGGGGFIMFYCPAQGNKLDEFMLKHNMPRILYMPTLHGSNIISNLSSSYDFKS